MELQVGKSSVAGGATFDDRRVYPLLGFMKLRSYTFRYPNRMWSQNMKYHYHGRMVINFLHFFFSLPVYHIVILPHLPGFTTTNVSQHHNCFILIPKCSQCFPKQTPYNSALTRNGDIFAMAFRKIIGNQDKSS